MTKPEDLADPNKLPDDLKLLLTAFKIQENDPLVAILAWHWLRINQTCDSLDAKRTAIDESAGKVQAILNVRKEQFESWTNTLLELFQHLDDINKKLTKEPLDICKAITEQLARPIGQSVELVQQLGTDAEKLVSRVDVSRERLTRANVITAFLSGYATAALIVSWIFFHFASR